MCPIKYTFPCTCIHAYSQRVDRAGCLLCLQEWEAGIKDLTYVIVFVPTHRRALLLRYRGVYCPFAHVCHCLCSVMRAASVAGYLVFMHAE